MKLYTRRGDQGRTQLFGGQDVGKDDLRVEAYGTVDELNSVLGVALAACTFDELRTVLLELQSRLFEVGADLATPGDPAEPSAVQRVGAEQVTQAEGWIDACSDATTPMRYFVLPGGTALSAQLHVARTVCRRAERRVVALAAHEPVNEQVIIYLNRLSDLFFAMARRANQLAGVDDIPWVSR